jgi:hypothetical protein
VVRDRGLCSSTSSWARLYHIVSHDAVLRLSAQTGDDVLTLREPGDEVVTQEHRVAQSGPTSVGTTDPVTISVDDKIRRRGVAKKQVVVKGALEVPKDALRGREMGLMGSCMWRHTCWTT